MGDDGYLEMDTAGVIAQANVLEQVGTTLDGAWAAAQGVLDAGRAGIGGGLLGNAFHRVYDPDEADVRAAANRVPSALSSSAGVAEQCAYLYRVADASGRDAMPAEGPRGGR
jgi:hypothetical protein